MTDLHKINTEKFNDFHLDEKVIGWPTGKHTEKPVGFI